MLDEKEHWMFAMLDDDWPTSVFSSGDAEGMRDVSKFEKWYPQSPLQKRLVGHMQDVQDYKKIDDRIFQVIDDDKEDDNDDDVRVILAALDEHRMMFMRVVGLGKANASRISSYDLAGIARVRQRDRQLHQGIGGSRFKSFSVRLLGQDDSQPLHVTEIMLVRSESLGVITHDMGKLIYDFVFNSYEDSENQLRNHSVAYL